MKIINTATGEVITEIITNHRITLDEALENCHLAVDDEGDVYDTDTGDSLGVGYDELDLI